MMRVMSESEVAEHDRQMDAIRAQMPEDVRNALRVLSHWVSMPDGWEETVERSEAAIWWMRKGANFDKPCTRPLRANGTIEEDAQ